MHVTVLKEVPQDPQLASSWNDLVMRMERPEVFYTHQWALAAAHAFEKTVLPLICLVHESSQLCGVAILATLFDSPQNAFFLTASTADYCDVVSTPAMRPDVVAAVLHELRRQGVRNLTLSNVPASSETLRHLKEVAQWNHYYVHERGAYECGLIVFGDAAERQHLLQSIKRKDHEKRGLKRMSQMGDVRISQVAEDAIKENLASIVSAQVSRFLATGRVSPLVRPERRSFLAELGPRLAQAGWLRINRLDISGHPVAWNFGFRFCDSWFWYLPTFEIQHEDLSPGSCLLRLLIEETCADPAVKRLDLGLGDEAYKERFANGVCPTRHLQLSASPSHHGKITARHFLVEGVRALQIESPIRKTRDVADGLRKRIRTNGLMVTAAHGFRRGAKPLLSKDEVRLFEAPPIDSPSLRNLTLAPMDWRQLANAAIANAEDVDTMNYLMRCAGRLRARSATGFALLKQDSQAAHFLWVSPYNGFHISEIDHTLGDSDPNAVMIFDCWTPASHRGRGYYADAMRAAAACLQQQDKTGWIFSAGSNHSSLRGISKAGFLHRFTLVRRTRLRRSHVIRLQPNEVNAQPGE